MSTQPDKHAEAQRVVAKADDGALVDRVQHDAFLYFLKNSNHENGLVSDSNQPNSPCSIAAVGFALSSYPVAVQHGWITRREATVRTLSALKFFRDADMSGSADATGYRGFYYHFLDMRTGRRAWNSELSSIDTAFLAAGTYLSAAYFDGEASDEKAIRETATALCDRIEWNWLSQDEGAVGHGWTPEDGFLPYQWIGYSEALVLYALALGSTRYAVSRKAYDAWVSGYSWRRIYDYECLYAGPLFIHQYSHIWLDFRGIADSYMRNRGIDYFENSRRATLIHREYGVRNPRHFRHYHGECWGLTACDGPGPRSIELDGKTIQLFGYAARGAPFGPDDGTVAPWASIASLPFAPEAVLPTLRHLAALTYEKESHFAFRCAFNPNVPEGPDSMGWVSPWHFGLNDGPIVLMVENYRSGLPWALTRRCRPLVRGLERADFRGGWLE